MLGIENIAGYLPEKTISNFDLKGKFEIDDDFITNKIGVESVSRLEEGQDTSDLAVKSFELLEKKVDKELRDIECLILVTQNPDNNLPHTSAVVHGKLELNETCACFDISLGCSGFVYALSVIEAFMSRHKMTKGVLITADPYSKIINPDDKNTTLLFGDGATSTLISDTPTFIPGEFTFGTIGKDYEMLINKKDGLFMNGRAIFNFAATKVPKDIKQVLEKNKLTIDEIDLFLLHQGSKYIVDTITKRLKISPSKVPFNATNYGNTVSSSIPLLLEGIIDDLSTQKVVASGFGVGLSSSSVILSRV